jgi:type IV secretory pathway TraG/TraD family ATPase VirD4
MKQKNVLEINPNDPHNWGPALDALVHSKYAQPLILLAVLGVVWVALEFRGGKTKLKDSAAWATKAHVKRCRELCTRQNLQGGIEAVGLELGTNLPLYDAVTSIVSIGAPKTGKTFSVVLPALYAHLKHQNPAVLVDVQYPVQTEQVVCLAQQLGYAAEDIHIFAPGCAESEIWNICEYAEGGQAAMLSKLLNENFATDGSKGDRFFDPAGEALISSTLQLARTIPGLDDIVGCQALLGLDDLPKRIRLNEHKIDPWIYRSFMQLLSTEKSEKTAASIAGIAANLFKRFIEEDIAPSLVGKTSFPLFLDGPKLIILGVRPDLREVIMPIQMALLSLLVDINSVPGRTTPLQVCFDELAAGTYRSLPSRINENRKYGVYFNLAFQNIAQLEERYGKNHTTATLGACGTQILMNPREQQTAKLISEMVGTQKYRETQRSRSVSGGKASRSTSTQVKERPLIPPHKVRMMGQGWAIVLNPGYRSPDGAQEYIPYKCKIRVFEDYKKLVKWSASQWPYAKQALSRRSPQRPVDPEYLRAGVRLSREYLRIPTQEEQDRRIADEVMIHQY